MHGASDAPCGPQFTRSGLLGSGTYVIDADDGRGTKSTMVPLGRRARDQSMPGPKL